MLGRLCMPPTEDTTIMLNLIPAVLSLIYGGGLSQGTIHSASVGIQWRPLCRLRIFAGSNRMNRHMSLRLGGVPTKPLGTDGGCERGGDGAVGQRCHGHRLGLRRAH